MVGDVNIFFVGPKRNLRWPVLSPGYASYAIPWNLTSPPPDSVTFEEPKLYAFHFFIQRPTGISLSLLKDEL
jgi:hypothetical protein